MAASLTFCCPLDTARPYAPGQVLDLKTTDAPRGNDLIRSFCGAKFFAKTVIPDLRLGLVPLPGRVG